MSQRASHGTPGHPPDLGRAFAATAAAHPARPALIDAAGTLTYHELLSLASAVSHQISALAAAPAVPVMITVGRTRASLVTLLGVLLSGRAYVPLDSASPQARREVIRTDSASGLYVDAVGGGPVALLPDLAGQEFPVGIAYLLYTSGSTGTPKGCLVTHGNVMSLFQATRALFTPSEDDVCSVVHSLAFDVSVWELWSAWLYGGAVWLASPEEGADPDLLAAGLARHDVTRLSLTPTLFSHVSDALIRMGLRLPSLRSVVLAGEAVELADTSRFLGSGLAPRAEVVNMYGITETTVHVTHRRLTGHERPIRSGATPVGLPIPGMQIELRDAGGQPVPAGTPGEMWVGGPGVSAGYWRRPELNRERFRVDEAGQRWYRSGDTGVFEGEYHHLGRADRQVQLRGFRVELGEVEAVLRSLPEVERALAVVEPRRDSQTPTLVAYIAVRPGADLPTAARLRAQAKALLPSYAVPQVIRAVRHFPTGTNGKIDVQALGSLSQPLPRNG